MLDRRAADAEIGHELSIDAMPDIRAGIADRKPDLLEHRQLRRSCRFEPGGAGNDGGMRAVELAAIAVQLPAQCRLGLAGLSQVAVGKHLRNARPGPRAARLRMLSAFQHQERAHGREARCRLAGPRSQTGANLSFSTTPPSSKASSTSQRVP